MVILFIIFRKTFLGELSLGEMVLIIQILNQLRRPLFAMSYILEQIQRAQADSKAFLSVLDLPGTEAFQAPALPRLIDQPEIRFDHVNFAYESGSPVLTDINLKLDKQKTVALVGHSGAGKTTVVNLILKLYDPTSGALSLSGTSYAQADHSWIRAHMALVFQDNELFSSTIRENVEYGMKGATDEQIILALKQANAYEFVEKFKDGLGEVIGERGVKLSGGQKQRVQIAREILHNKPILILDEATSSLDSKSERLVQEALEKLFENRLVIIIAHRFSTIRYANRIIVMEEGRVIGQGTHNELYASCEPYKRLVDHQIERTGYENGIESGVNKLNGIAEHNALVFQKNTEELPKTVEERREL